MLELETGAQPPDGVTMHGRWHGVSGRHGFLLAEASDPVAVTQWMQAWTDLVTFEIEPVIDDEQFSGVIG